MVSTWRKAMARADWEPAEMHRLANDLRLLVKDIDSTKVSHIKQFADQLDMQATDMEEHGRTYLQDVQFPAGLGVRP